MGSFCFGSKPLIPSLSDHVTGTIKYVLAEQIEFEGECEPQPDAQPAI